MKQNNPVCVKCRIPMHAVILPQYEYVEGIPLQHVVGYQCPHCSRIFFTEKQVKILEARMTELKKHLFGFERRITTSGTSLAITIPQELAQHLSLHHGSKVRIVPIARDGFLVTETNT